MPHQYRDSPLVPPKVLHESFCLLANIFLLKISSVVGCPHETVVIVVHKNFYFLNSKPSINVHPEGRTHA